MAPFQFPPPPPPPPKATSNDAPDQYASQRGGFQGVRGGRGRGYHGRGRGNAPRGNNRGGYGSGPSQRGGSYQQNAPPRQGQYSGLQPYTPQPNPSQNTYNGGYAGGQQAAQPQPYGAPAQAAQPTVDPMAFAQAMAYMSTPAGMQTFSAVASQMASGNQNQAPQIPQQPSQGSPSQLSHKRKRDEYNHTPRTPAQIAPSKPKPPRAKALPPPAVPSFGFSLPSVPAAQPARTPKHTKHDGGKKRKINLGLTGDSEPQEEEDHIGDESGAEEDVDEEAAFAANSKIEGGMAFEYNGQQISLQTPAEISAWIKDRSKNFPTKERIAEKAQETVERRANELEFLRKVQGKKSNRPSRLEPAKPTANTARKPSTEQSKAELGSLRARVEQSLVAKQKPSNASVTPLPSAPPQRPHFDLGLGYASDSESSSYSILNEESSAVSSSSDESSDEASDSDDAPEAESSKAEPPPFVPPPPPPPKPEPKKEDDGVCQQWKRWGNCKKGNKCKLEHPAKEEPKMMTLYERLVEQEKEKADRLALDAIKWLGRNGFLG